MNGWEDERVEEWIGGCMDNGRVGGEKVHGWAYEWEGVSTWVD